MSRSWDYLAGYQAGYRAGLKRKPPAQPPPGPLPGQMEMFGEDEDRELEEAGR